MKLQKKQRTEDPIICRCNGVRQSVIEKAIQRGCSTLNQIFDSTQAGVGPCGGSCRVLLDQLLKSYKKTRSFPKNLRRK